MNSPFSPPTFTKTTTAADMFVQTVYFHVGQKLEEVRATSSAKCIKLESFHDSCCFFISYSAHNYHMSRNNVGQTTLQSFNTLSFCLNRGSFKKPTLWQHIPSPHEYFTPLYHTYQGDFKVGCASKSLVHKQKSLCE